MQRFGSKPQLGCGRFAVVGYRPDAYASLGTAPIAFLPQSCEFCNLMQEPVYKLIELTGTSTRSMEDAVNNALRRASLTIKNLRWFEVVETRGDIKQNSVAHW